MFSNPPKVNSNAFFAIKSSFEFPTLATPNEADCTMKDWWQMTSLQEYLVVLCFYFSCLTTAFLRQFHFVCFLSRKTPHHHWNGVATRVHGFATKTKALAREIPPATQARIGRISWFLAWCHDPFRNPDPFLHWLTVNFIGRGWSGDFKARS